MPQFTTSQVYNIKQGLLDSFTEEHIYWRDEQGNTLLHHLIDSDRPQAEIERVLEMGVSPHLYNQAFQTPIQRAFAKRNWPVVERLLRERIVLPVEYFDQLLNAAYHRCSHLTDNSEAQNQEIAFLASRLSGTNITTPFNQYKDKYLGHLNWFQGTSLITSSELEKFWPDIMLSLRLFATLKLWVNTRRGRVDHFAELEGSSSGAERCRLHCDYLRKKLLQIWQTLMLINLRTCIDEKSPAPQRGRLFNAHGQGLARTIAALQNTESVIISHVWYQWCPGATKESGHAIYVQIRKTREWQLLLHNLGDGYPEKHSTTTEGLVKPFGIAKFTDGAVWAPAGKGTHYLIACLQAQCQSTAYVVNGQRRTSKPYRAELMAQIYNATGALSLLMEEQFDTSRLLPLRAQTVGNCVVVNHSAGCFFSYPQVHAQVFTEWLLRQENSIVAGFDHHVCLSDYPSTLWDRPDIIFPDTMSPDKILRYHQRRYALDFAMLPAFFNSPAMPMDAFFVELALYKLKKPDSAAASGARGPRVTASNEMERVSILYDQLFGEEGMVVLSGPAGVGKTTLAHSIAYRWAKGQVIEGIDRVVCLSLRDLKKRHVVDNPDVFLTMGFWMAENLQLSCDELEADALGRQLFDGKTLWLLDGYDEVSSGLSRGQQQLRDALMTQPSVSAPRVLVSTRPHCLDVLKARYGLQQHIEITGFNDQQLKAFIAAHLRAVDSPLWGVRSSATVEPGVIRQQTLLLDFLKAHPQAEVLARYPINARLMCICFAQGSLSLQALTVTQLYENLEQVIYQHYREKSGVSVSSITKDDKLTRLQQWLAQMAFEAIKADKLLIEYVDLITQAGPIVQDVIGENSLLTPEIGRLDAKLQSGTATSTEAAKLAMLQDKQRVLAGIKTPEQLINSLLELGVVKGVWTGTFDLRESIEVEFLHLSFQEYYAAKHIVDACSKDDPAMVDWIAHNKYVFRYELMWRFAAGLATEAERSFPGTLERFGQGLLMPPRDFGGYFSSSGGRELQLWLKMAQEAGWYRGDVAAPSIKGIIKHLHTEAIAAVDQRITNSSSKQTKKGHLDWRSLSQYSPGLTQKIIDDNPSVIAQIEAQLQRTRESYASYYNEYYPSDLADLSGYILNYDPLKHAFYGALKDWNDGVLCDAVGVVRSMGGRMLHYPELVEWLSLALQHSHVGARMVALRILQGLGEAIFDPAYPGLLLGLGKALMERYVDDLTCALRILENQYQQVLEHPCLIEGLIQNVHEISDATIQEVGCSYPRSLREQLLGIFLKLQEKILAFPPYCEQLKLALLASMWEHQNMQVRRSEVELLVRLDVCLSRYPRFIRELTRALEEEKPSTALSILHKLKAQIREPAYTGLFPRLHALLADDDYLIRVQVLNILIAFGKEILQPQYAWILSGLKATIAYSIAISADKTSQGWEGRHLKFYAGQLLKILGQARCVSEQLCDAGYYQSIPSSPLLPPMPNAMGFGYPYSCYYDQLMAGTVPETFDAGDLKSLFDYYCRKIILALKDNILYVYGESLSFHQKILSDTQNAQLRAILMEHVPGFLEQVTTTPVVSPVDDNTMGMVIEAAAPSLPPESTRPFEQTHAAPPAHPLMPASTKCCVIS